MIGTGFVVLLFGLLPGVRPGLGTICVILIVGNIVNLLYAHDPIATAQSWNFLVRVALFIFGTVLTGLGIAIEAIGFTCGLILRGPVGLGTIIWTLVIGTSAGFWFKVLHLTPHFVERGNLIID